MRARREVHLFLFVLVAIGVLGESNARPSEGLDQLEEDYPVYDVLGRKKQASEGSPGSAGSEGTFSSWWSERRPCVCANRRCGCCTGTLFPLPPWLRPRVCTNLTYIEDEFALKMAVSFNDVIMYRNTVSGRNPPPVCISPPRIRRAQLCIKLQDVYLIDRNMHACMSVEGLYNKQVLFGRMLGCMRMGTNGFAIVNPEDGGGLPLVEPADPDDEPNDEDDYDQVDEDDPVEEDNTVETEADDGGGDQSGGDAKTAGTANDEGAGVNKGAAGPARVSGPEETAGGAETAEPAETEKTALKIAEVEGSVKSTVDRMNTTGAQDELEHAVAEESLNDTGVEESSTATKDQETGTLGDEGLVSTNVAEVENGSDDAVSPMNPEMTEESGETTTEEEFPKTTEIPDMGMKTGGPKEEDEKAVEKELRKEAVAVGGEVNEKSTVSEVKRTGTEEFREVGREEKRPEGSKDEVNADDADSGFDAKKEELPKRSRELLDEEIVGVGTVEAL